MASQHAIFFCARVPQIWKNFTNKSTGELSFLTSFMNFAGSLGKSFYQHPGEDSVKCTYGLCNRHRDKRYDFGSDSDVPKACAEERKERRIGRENSCCWFTILLQGYSWSNMHHLPGLHDKNSREKIHADLGDDGNNRIFLRL
uniref:Uncharacterized protein n=1 Tax=Aegilops tauschii subsp. strangulata TaxID=200361 RepID=A0A453PYU7_AEGTS